MKNLDPEPKAFILPCLNYRLSFPPMSPFYASLFTFPYKANANFTTDAWVKIDDLLHIRLDENNIEELLFDGIRGAFFKLAFTKHS